MKVTNEEGVKHLWRRMLRRLKTKESSSNKKTSIDEYSTDADYPSAKAVYGFVNDKVEEKTAICRGTFLSQSLLPNKSICPDLKHGDYAFVNGDNNLGPNTNHYLYVETPKITLNSDTRTYTFKEQVSNEGATFPYKWGGGAGANYREVYTAVKFPGNGSKAASSYDIPVADAEYTVYDHTVHGGWVFTRALGNGAVPATHIQDTAAQSTNLAQVMLEAGAAPSGSQTGEGQYGQNEINEALAEYVGNINEEKENRITVVAASGTSLTAEVGKLYRFSGDVNTLNVTLPQMTDTQHVYVISFSFTTGTTPSISFGSGVVFQDSFNIEANTYYELTALWNGSVWSVATVAKDQRMALVVAHADANNNYNAAVNTYNRFDAVVNNLNINLPAVSDNSYVTNIAFAFTTGSTPNITITPPTGVTTSYEVSYLIQGGQTYEVNALWNGLKWIIASIITG